MGFAPPKNISLGGPTQLTAPGKYPSVIFCSQC